MKDEQFDDISAILKGAVMSDITPDADFNGQVIRRAKLERKAKSLEALSPVLIGAAAAMIGVIAILQVISQPTVNPAFQPTMHEASLEGQSHPVMPTLSE